MARQEIEKIGLVLDQALDLMKQGGATHAEAYFSSKQKSSIQVRQDKVESIETAKPASIGLLMRIGDKSESVSVNSRSIDDLAKAVADLTAAVRRMPDNIYDRPADDSRLSRIRTHRSLDVIDRSRVPLEALIEKARAAEAAALAVPGVSFSKAASANWERSLTVSRDTKGHEFISERSYSVLSVAVIARDQGEQRSGGEHTVASHIADLANPEDIGRTAGIEAVQALHPGSLRPGRMPVVFHPDIGSSLLGHFESAIDGTGIRKKTSFLTDSLNSAVFAPSITIKDDPHLRRGLASACYSGSGMPTKELLIVENGVVKTWFMDLEDARRLGFENADQIRGSTNLTIEPGTLTPDELVADIKEGFFVTELMGQGVDLTSGHYSRTAAGFRISNGKIDYGQPVEKMTITSNLKDMFARMSVANDLRRLRSSTAVPTLRVEGMSIS